jgi:uncharacterized alkaline shock family protein YloU
MAPCSVEIKRIAHKQAAAHDDVARMSATWGEWFRFSNTPGVRAWSDNEGWLNVSVAIVAGRETNLLDLGIQIQKAIRAGIRQVTNQPLGRIDVNVTGIAAKQK